MKVVRWICFGYCAALTVGLLHPKGGKAPGLLLGGALGGPPVAHLLAFCVLAVLVHAADFRVRLLPLMALLSGYAVTTELLQAVIPHRAADPVDVASNLLGLAAGTIAWRLAVRCGLRPCGRRVEPAQKPTSP